MSAKINAKPIGSVTTWLSGGTPDRSRSDYWDGRIPWITAFTLKTAEIRDSDQHISPEAVSAGSKMAPVDSTLLLVRGSALHKEIRAGLVILPVAFNQDVKALIPNAAVVPKYLTHVLRGSEPELLKLVTSAGNTAGVLDTKVVQAFEIFLPTLTEQSQIVAAMDEVDDLIATLERLIVKKQAIKQGMMQQLLTGRTRLPGFDGEWRDSSLGSVASVTMGQSPAGSTYNSDARGLPLVQGNADIRGRVTFDRIWTSAPTKTCEAGDVLLTVRAPVGYTAVASQRSCLGRGVCSISAHHDNKFVFHALVYAEPAWALYEQGSTFTAVNSNEVRSFALLWPTDPDERRAIARVLDDSDKELASLQARLVKARAIKTGMMQQLLTGRTRLPVEVES